MVLAPFRFHYAWIILAIGTSVTFAAIGLARFGYSAILPSMQVALVMSNTQAGMLATANLTGYLILSAIGGALASRYSSRVIIAIGLLCTGVAMILTGLANNFFSAVAWRALTGVGSGASNVPVMALMSTWFSKRYRGFASGIAVSGSSVALIIVGPLIPFILSSYGDIGWRISWFILGAINLSLSVLVWFLLRDDPVEKGMKPLGSQNENLLLGQHNGRESWSKAYRLPDVWHLAVVYFCFGFSYIIYMTFFVKSLVSDVGYSKELAGKLFMLLGWSSLLCGLLWGSLSDLIGRKWTLAIIYLIQSISFALFALSDNTLGFAISAVMFGLTAWSIPAIMSATCADILGPKLAPAALGFITVFFGVGQAFAPSVAGKVADIYGSFANAFLIAAVVSALGSLGSLLLRTVKRN